MKIQYGGQFGQCEIHDLAINNVPIPPIRQIWLYVMYFIICCDIRSVSSRYLNAVCRQDVSNAVLCYICSIF